MAYDFIGPRSARLANLTAMPATRQLIRYVFAGLCVTQFAAAIYSGAVSIVRLDPLLANVVSTACGLMVGYLVHSRWSFAADPSATEGWQVGRFLLASFFAFLINSMWIWLLTRVLHLSPMAPVPLMMLATPWISFLLNRYWVFKAT
jgi:putative flippase GtrA